MEQWPGYARDDGWERLSAGVYHSVGGRFVIKRKGPRNWHLVDNKAGCGFIFKSLGEAQSHARALKRQDEPRPSDDRSSQNPIDQQSEKPSSQSHARSKPQLIPRSYTLASAAGQSIDDSSDDQGCTELSDAETARYSRLLSRECDKMMEKFEHGRRQGWHRTFSRVTDILSQPGKADSAGPRHRQHRSDIGDAGPEARVEYDDLCRLLDHLKAIGEEFEEHLGFIDSYLARVIAVPNKVGGAHDEIKNRAHDCRLCFGMILTLWGMLDEYVWSNPKFDSYRWQSYDEGKIMTDDQSWFLQMVDKMKPLDFPIVVQIVRHLRFSPRLGKLPRRSD